MHASVFFQFYQHSIINTTIKLSPPLIYRLCRIYLPNWPAATFATLFSIARFFLFIFIRIATVFLWALCVFSSAVACLCRRPNIVPCFQVSFLEDITSTVEFGVI